MKGENRGEYKQYPLVYFARILYLVCILQPLSISAYTFHYASNIRVLLYSFLLHYYDFSHQRKPAIS
jgi:hypothetical protein